tara:strand:- start:566 stop:718 length:153 start_codon:yes stop_codon:yes gene_type:complete
MITKIIDCSVEAVFVISAIFFGVLIGSIMAFCMPIAIPAMILMTRYKKVK